MHLKSDTLLLVDVFENFRKMCLKIYKLKSVKFLSAPVLAWQAALKETDMLIMVEKGIRGSICHAIHRCAKANNKYMKDYDKNRYLKYWDVNHLYGWTMSQKFPVNKSEWIKDTSQFNEGFIKKCNEESDERYFLEVDVQYPEKLHEPHNDLPFLPERMKLEKVEKLAANLHDQTEYVIHIINLKQALNYG